MCGNTFPKRKTWNTWEFWVVFKTLFWKVRSPWRFIRDYLMRKSVKRLHEADLYWTRPLVHQSQSSLLQLAATYQGLSDGGLFIYPADILLETVGFVPGTFCMTKRCSTIKPQPSTKANKFPESYVTHHYRFSPCTCPVLKSLLFGISITRIFHYRDLFPYWKPFFSITCTLILFTFKCLTHMFIEEKFIAFIKRCMLFHCIAYHYNN